MNLAQITKLTEEQAREYLESIRWPDGPVCPHCSSKEVTKLQGDSTRPGVYKCKAKECRKKFSVTVGTIFERSHIKLREWVIAFHLMCSSKKGISAHQLHRELGITYKSAWFMCHRIRHAMIQPGGMFTGTVEVDETYIGPKHVRGKRGRGAGKKQAVVALVDRGGKARAVRVGRVNGQNLRHHVRLNVDTTKAKLMTDEFPGYNLVSKDFGDRHETVNHSAHQYIYGNAGTNTAESFFALLKRGVHGIFHHVSPQHLQRYCDEFSFRWSERKATDGDRTVTALRGAEGKRLMYA